MSSPVLSVIMSIYNEPLKYIQESVSFYYKSNVKQY